MSAQFTATSVAGHNTSIVQLTVQSKTGQLATLPAEILSSDGKLVNCEVKMELCFPAPSLVVYLHVCAFVCMFEYFVHAHMCVTWYKSCGYSCCGRCVVSVSTSLHVATGSERQSTPLPDIWKSKNDSLLRLDHLLACFQYLY